MAADCWKIRVKMKILLRNGRRVSSIATCCHQFNREHHRCECSLESTSNVNSQQFLRWQLHHCFCTERAVASKVKSLPSWNKWERATERLIDCKRRNGWEIESKMSHNSVFIFILIRRQARNREPIPFKQLPRTKSITMQRSGFTDEFQKKEHALSQHQLASFLQFFEHSERVIAETGQVDFSCLFFPLPLLIRFSFAVLWDMYGIPSKPEGWLTAWTEAKSRTIQGLPCLFFFFSFFFSFLFYCSFVAFAFFIRCVCSASYHEEEKKMVREQARRGKRKKLAKTHSGSSSLTNILLFSLPFVLFSPDVSVTGDAQIDTTPDCVTFRYVSLRFLPISFVCFGVLLHFFCSIRAEARNQNQARALSEMETITAKAMTVLNNYCVPASAVQSSVHMRWDRPLLLSALVRFHASLRAYGWMLLIFGLFLLSAQTNYIPRTGVSSVCCFSSLLRCSGPIFLGSSCCRSIMFPCINACVSDCLLRCLFVCFSFSQFPTSLNQLWTAHDTVQEHSAIKSITISLAGETMQRYQAVSLCDQIMCSALVSTLGLQCLLAKCILFSVFWSAVSLHNFSSSLSLLSLQLSNSRSSLPLPVFFQGFHPLCFECWALGFVLFALPRMISLFVLLHPSLFLSALISTFFAFVFRLFSPSEFLSLPCCRFFLLLQLMTELMATGALSNGDVCISCMSSVCARFVCECNVRKKQDLRW